MPYRRLPNTDAARIKALRTALSIGKEIPPFKLAYSQHSLLRLQSFISYFEQALSNQKQTYENQVRNSLNYKDSLKKIKLYISHFIQVMNMAILRGELPEDTRSYFMLNNDLRSVPSLNTEKEILEVGENIINGEMERLKKGKTAITNPTMAVVKVRYEQFLDAYNFQKTLQKRNKMALEKLASLRGDADAIILDIWNEVEDHFKDLPENMKRDEAVKYGLVYVFRKNELLRIHFSQPEQRGIG
jgi:hypothetical protein